MPEQARRDSGEDPQAELIRLGWPLERTHDLNRLVDELVARNSDLPAVGIEFHVVTGKDAVVSAAARGFLQPAIELGAGSGLAVHRERVFATAARRHVLRKGLPFPASEGFPTSPQGFLGFFLEVFNEDDTRIPVVPVRIVGRVGSEVLTKS
jgi:hypothetical protein